MNAPFVPWGEIAPSPDLEALVVSSLYLQEIGIGVAGPVEEIAHRLVVELARTRKALEDQFQAFDAENRRLRRRWEFEHHICNDMIEENAELAERLELAEFEAAENFKAWETAQARLENALTITDELASAIDWDALLDGDDNEA